jgi:CRISPR type III-B/RAMP module RAMP protein Cmr6
MLLPNTDHFAGTVSFLPAYPHHLPANDLELDIVTCHHPRYYRADPDMPVALDIEEPNPVVFPAVAAGVVFQFAILPIHRAWLGLVGQVSDLTVPGVSDSVGTPGGIASAAPTNKAGSQGPEASATGRPEVCSTAARLLTRAREWLRQGLETFGLGAKTAAGYGWFAEVDATGATPTTSRPQPSSAGLPVAAPATPAATEHPLVTQWRGKTQPANFRAFRPALAALKDDAELKRVFQAIMPVGELSKLKRANPYWQSFVSHPEGGAILKRLKLELR